MHGRNRLLVIILLVAAATLLARGQAASPTRVYLPDPLSPPVRVSAFPDLPHPATRAETNALQQLTRSAGIIFSGTVGSVTASPAAHGTIPTVGLTFHVEHGLRGARDGQTLNLQQWMGTWSSGQRYRAGERVLVFLYPPSKLGLTSCVSGDLGRFRVDAAGRIRFSEQQLTAFRTDPVLGGKSSISLRDFAQAVRRAGGGD